MNNNSFLFITPSKVENYSHTRINHNYESLILPPEFIVELKNKMNGNNLLSEINYNLKDIILTNGNNKEIDIDICTIDNTPFINLSALGWFDGFNDYELKIGSDLSINFSLDMHKTNNKGKEFYDKSDFTVYDNHNIHEDGIITIEV